jgi:hypothetical protein
MRSTQTPLQSSRPASHAQLQADALQVAVALAGAVHTWPHAPQLATSLVVSTQVPPHAVVRGGTSHV